MISTPNYKTLSLSPPARLFLPDFPGPLDRPGVSDRRAAALFVAQELDRSLELHCLKLKTRVHLGIDRAEHGLLHARADDGHAMAAHQHAVALAERAGQCFA